MNAQHSPSATLLPTSAKTSPHLALPPVSKEELAMLDSSYGSRNEVLPSAPKYPCPLPSSLNGPGNQTGPGGVRDEEGWQSPGLSEPFLLRHMTWLIPLLSQGSGAAPLGHLQHPRWGNLQSVNMGAKAQATQDTLAPGDHRVSVPAPWARLQHRSTASSHGSHLCPQCSKQSVERRGFEESGRQRHRGDHTVPPARCPQRARGDGDLGDKGSLHRDPTACRIHHHTSHLLPQLAVCHWAQVQLQSTWSCYLAVGEGGQVWCVGPPLH